MLRIIALSYVLAVVSCEAKSAVSNRPQVQRQSPQVSGAKGKRSSSVADPPKRSKVQGAYLQTKRALMVESAEVVQSTNDASAFTEPAEQAHAHKAEAFIQQSKALRIESARFVDSSNKAKHRHRSSTSVVDDRESGFGGSDERSCEAAHGGRCRFSDMVSTSRGDVYGRVRSGGVLMQKLSDLSPLEAVGQQIADPFAGLDDAFDDAGLDLMSELSESTTQPEPQLLVEEEKPAERRQTGKSEHEIVSYSQGVSYAQILSIILEISIGIIVAKSALMLCFPGEKEIVHPPSSSTFQISSVRSRKIARVALARAARHGDADRVRALLEAGAEVCSADSWGCTPLHMAADAGASAVAAVLLDHGTYVDVRDSWEETPLHFAARSGKTETCQVLIGGGAAVNAVDLDSQTALIKAARAGHTVTCELLLENGGGVEDVSDAELPPVLSALLMKQMLACNALHPTCRASTSDSTSDVDEDSEERYLAEMLSGDEL